MFFTWLSWNGSACFFSAVVPNTGRLSNNSPLSNFCKEIDPYIVFILEISLHLGEKKKKKNSTKIANCISNLHIQVFLCKVF